MDPRQRLTSIKGFRQSREPIKGFRLLFSGGFVSHQDSKSVVRKQQTMRIMGLDQNRNRPFIFLYRNRGAFRAQLDALPPRDFINPLSLGVHPPRTTLVLTYQDIRDFW